MNEGLRNENVNLFWFQPLLASTSSGIRSAGVGRARSVVKFKILFTKSRFYCMRVA